MKTVTTAIVLSLVLTGPALARTGEGRDSADFLVSEVVVANGAANSSATGVIVPLILLMVVALAAAAD